MVDQCPKCSGHVPAGSHFCQACGSKVGVNGKKPQPAKVKQKKPVKGGFLWVGLGGLLAIALIGLLIFRPGGASPVVQMPHDEMMAHLLTEAGPVPAWLAKADRAVVTEYTWAVDHHEELQYIPCYCGCYQSSGHTSNYNCYFSQGPSGQVTSYDMHSYG